MDITKILDITYLRILMMKHNDFKLIIIFFCLWTKLSFFQINFLMLWETFLSPMVVLWSDQERVEQVELCGKVSFLRNKVRRTKDGIFHQIYDFKIVLQCFCWSSLLASGQWNLHLPGDCRKQKCEDKCGINIAVTTNGTN